VGVLEPSLEVLVGRASCGDVEAEAWLLERYLPPVRVYARRRLRTAAEIEEFVQDVALIVIEALRGGRVQAPERFGSFCLGVCRNLALDQATRAVRRRELWSLFGPRAEDATARIPEEAVAMRAHLEDCLSKLSTRAREVLGRTYYEGASSAEIATQLDMSEGNVRVVRHRSLRALRTCLERGLSYGGGDDDAR
jgi:RNA polymerase sigma-70 factor (ECF subfamily)